MEHSKLPWGYKEVKWVEEYKFYKEEKTGYVIYDNDCRLIDETEEKSKANTVFIIEACNNYERLQAENKAWETNYNILLEQHEEVSAIAQEQAREIESLKERLKKALSVGGE